MELKKPSAEHQQLAAEWMRQYQSGERDAGYWKWYFNDIQVDVPAFSCESVYRYEPSKAHPHYTTWCQWENHKKSGAVSEGYYELVAKDTGKPFVCMDANNAVGWYVNRTYEIRKTDQHPDNHKPKLKLLDWEQAPVGALTNCGVISGWAAAIKYVVVFDGFTIKHINPSRLRLVKAVKWTAIQDGEHPPVCKGLIIEYRGMDNEGWQKCTPSLSEIYGANAYRVIGIREGWTDDPAKVGV